jgi:hypothetical protein
MRCRAVVEKEMMAAFTADPTSNQPIGRNLRASRSEIENGSVSEKSNRPIFILILVNNYLHYKLGWEKKVWNLGVHFI